MNHGGRMLFSGYCKRSAFIYLVKYFNLKQLIAWVLKDSFKDWK